MEFSTVNLDDSVSTCIVNTLRMVDYHECLLEQGDSNSQIIYPCITLSIDSRVPEEDVIPMMISLLLIGINNNYVIRVSIEHLMAKRIEAKGTGLCPPNDSMQPKAIRLPCESPSCVIPSYVKPPRGSKHRCSKIHVTKLGNDTDDVPCMVYSNKNLPLLFKKGIFGNKSS